MNLITRIRTCLTLLALVTAALCLSACNTVEGAGEDVEAVGDAVQDAAD